MPSATEWKTEMPGRKEKQCFINGKAQTNKRTHRYTIRTLKALNCFVLFSFFVLVNGKLDGFCDFSHLVVHSCDCRECVKQMAGKIDGKIIMANKLSVVKHLSDFAVR